MITKITTHNQDAKDRLLFQYKGKVRIEETIDALIGNQFQDLEDAAWNLLGRLDVDSMEGVQLDKLGTIVGQERLGLPDEDYRIFIKARIGQNVSEGDHERVVSVFKILAQATLVYLNDLGRGAMILGANNIITDRINLFFEAMNRATGAGIRVDGFVFFDDTEPFACESAGSGLPGKGFGSTTDPAAGGKLATLKTDKKDFALSGVDKTAGGLGTIFDPLVGGVLYGL